MQAEIAVGAFDQGWPPIAAAAGVTLEPEVLFELHVSNAARRADREREQLLATNTDCAEAQLAATMEIVLEDDARF